MLSRVMMIAGEASGDLHGSGVVKELKQRIPTVDIYGIGGDRMKHAGMDLLHHMSELSFMGFVEVVRNLPIIRSVEREMERVLTERRPDVLVLIDYPGFNLRIARKAKGQGIKVLYYISPQVWAWNKGRVKKMKSFVDRMKVVFPFEVDLYEKEGINVEFVGHPLTEAIGSSTTRSEFFDANRLDRQKKLLALFPGSRKQEVERIFPVMLDAARTLQRSYGVQVAVGVASNLGAGFLRPFLRGGDSIQLVEDGTYDLMQHADAAIVTSGTATLETGWFGTPMAVVYRTSPLTFFIGRMLVNISSIGLVNIVAGKQVVPEFIQGRMNPASLAVEVGRMLEDDGYARSIRENLSIIKSKLGEPGASARVARGIIELAAA